MKPFDPNFHTNYHYDDYRDLPVSVLELFEWAHENNEGSSTIHVTLNPNNILIKLP